MSKTPVLFADHLKSDQFREFVRERGTREGYAVCELRNGPRLIRLVMEQDQRSDDCCRKASPCSLLRTPANTWKPFDLYSSAVTCPFPDDEPVTRNVAHF